jgi:hypothetical protein
MGDPRIDALMPACEELQSHQVRELLFFLIGWMDGDDHFVDGLQHWIETEPTV